MVTVIILCGPTAVGKTSLALELAPQLNAEIISADSGQVYRDCSIGTGKPTLEEQKQVRHHCIDILNPNEVCSAALWAQEARTVIDKLVAAGKTPLVVGGTGLYIKALLGGLFEGPGRDEEVRRQLEEILRDKGVNYLHEQLKKVDPESAEKNESLNPQRIIRALEVYQLTDRPISEWQKISGPPLPYPVQQFGLSLEREELYARINARVLKMFELGWIDETRALIQQWGENIPALKLVGYREITSHLRGELTREQCVLLTQQKTRNYAKRQMTWFRGDKSIQWFEAQSSPDASILNYINNFK